MVQFRSGFEKRGAAVLAAHFLVGFGRWFVLLMYLVWIMSVLKHANGTESIDARELLVIYPLSSVGAVLLMSLARKKLLRWLER